MGWYDRKVRRVRDLSCGDTRIFLELEVRRLDCRNCGKVKRERLDFMADNPLYTKRFAYFVGRRCRQASIADVVKELALDWRTVKALEMQYMEVQLARVGRPGPQVSPDAVAFQIAQILNMLHRVSFFFRQAGVPQGSIRCILQGVEGTGVGFHRVRQQRRSVMKVKDVMHKGVDWVSPATPVTELAKLMREHDIGAIPIGENDRLIGMVTDRDIVAPSCV